jgi:hypothetical protein
LIRIPHHARKTEKDGESAPRFAVFRAAVHCTEPKGSWPASLAERLAVCFRTPDHGLLDGRNGEGDPYYTDGEIWLARLVGRGNKADNAAKILPPPALIQINDVVFSWHSSGD